MTMACADEVDDNISSEFYSSVAIRPVFESTLNEQLWWMYPIAKFFGHALYEYYYNIDFIDCADQMEIQKRNRVLYESYCNLVGSLIVMYAKDYNTTVYNVIKEVKHHVDTQFNDQSILNLLRAVYGIEHFGYTIMRYCGSFKLSCCRDMKECLMSTGLKLPTTNQVFYAYGSYSLLQRLAKEVLLEYIGTVEDNVYKNQLKAFEFLKCHEGTSTLMKEMHLHGPYICQYGILLNYPSFSEYDYLIIDVHSQLVEVASVNKDIKSKPRTPVDTKGKIREDRHLTARQGNKDIPCSAKSSISPSAEQKKIEGMIPRLLPATSNELLHQFQLKSRPPTLCLPSTSLAVNPSECNFMSIESKSKEGKFHSPHLVLTSTVFSTLSNKWNRITLPKDRQKFVLHEFDCRIKKHIAFQAASFEQENAKNFNQKLSNLIHQQRKFEEMWPLKRSKVKPSIRIKEFFDENMFSTEIKTEDLDISELVKEAERVTMLLRFTLEEL